MVERIPMSIHPRYWDRTVKEAFKNDPIRMPIELIKNSADSYERLILKKKISPPMRIWVELVCRRNKSPIIKVRDNAEGMDLKRLKEVLEYGAPTSGYIGSGEKGIGLKDVLMAMVPEGSIKTIKNGKINEFKMVIRAYYDIIRKNEDVSVEEREKLGIPNNGTIVGGRVPEYFPSRTFRTIFGQLRSHFMMRKLLQCPEYDIRVVDRWRGLEKSLKYSPPQIDKEITKEEFEIPYNGKKYRISLLINRAKKTLSQGKPFGEAGLIFYYGKYSVLDLSLGDYSRDPAANKLFGEVKMEIEDLIKNGEILVDEKRRGLDLTHPFNIKLFNEINSRLRKIVEQEKEASEYSFDQAKVRDVLKELNKICKDVRGIGPPPPPPIEPETLAFYPVYLSIREYEEKPIFLIINSGIIQDELEISLRSTNPDIITKRGKIKIKKEDVETKFIIKKIPILGKNSGIKGEIFAETLQHTEKAGIEVLENPMFSPKNGFAFVPDKTTIVDGGNKKVNLIIEPRIIKENLKDISLRSSNFNIICPGKWILPDKQKLDERMIKNILKIEIPIEVKQKKGGCIGEKGIISASYDDLKAEMAIEVIPEPTLGGLFRGIELSAEITQKISEFDKKTGVLKIYYKHPLIKKYRKKKNFQNRSDFLIFITDIITREAIRAMVENAIETGSSKFPIYDLDDPHPEIERYIIQEYYNHGLKMHDILPKVVKTFKLVRK